MCGFECEFVNFVRVFGVLVVLCDLECVSVDVVVLVLDLCFGG